MISEKYPSIYPALKYRNYSVQNARCLARDLAVGKILFESYTRRTSRASWRRERERAKIFNNCEVGFHITACLSQRVVYVEHGREMSLKDTVCQCRERREFSRRLRNKARQGQKDLLEPFMLEHASKRAAARNQRSIQPVEAAIKIQRAYRAHRALVALTVLEHRIKIASDPSHDAVAVLAYLRARAADLGAIGALLDDAPHMSSDPRILRRARRVTKTLRRALDQAEVMRTAQGIKVIWVEKLDNGQIGSGGIVFNTNLEEDPSGPEFDDIIHNSWHSETEQLGRRDFTGITPLIEKAELRWTNDSSAELFLPEISEEEYELGMGVPDESADEGVSEARRAAFVSLCQGSEKHRQWIAQILAARPLFQPGRRRSISKMPELLTIAEGSELEE